MAGQLSAPYCGESAQKRRTTLGLQKRWANYVCGTAGRGNIKEKKSVCVPASSISRRSRIRAGCGSMVRTWFPFTVRCYLATDRLRTFEPYSVERSGV